MGGAVCVRFSRGRSAAQRRILRRRHTATSPEPIAQSSDGVVKVMSAEDAETGDTFTWGNEWTLSGEGFEGSAAGWEVAFGVVTLDAGEDPISLDVSTESATEVSASALPGSEVEAGTYPNATLKLTIERRDGDDPVSETLNIPIHLVVGE